jgi:uncharacterized protein YggU (UPF0235/DUF167 family)
MWRVSLDGSLGRIGALGQTGRDLRAGLGGTKSFEGFWQISSKKFVPCPRVARKGITVAMTDLAHLAVPGAEISVRVTPNARRAGVAVVDGQIRIAVTVVPEDGRATEAAREALAKALGVAKSRLVLVRGAKSRDKLFRLDAP